MKPIALIASSALAIAIILFILKAWHPRSKPTGAPASSPHSTERTRAQRKFLLIILRRGPAHIREDTLEAAARSAWSGHFGPDGEGSKYVDRGIPDRMYVLQAHGNAFTVVETKKEERHVDPPLTFLPNSAARLWSEYSHDTSVGIAYNYDSDPAKLAAFVARLTASLCDDESIAIYHPATRRLWKLDQNTIHELNRNPIAFFETTTSGAQ